MPTSRTGFHRRGERIDVARDVFISYRQCTEGGFVRNELVPRLEKERWLYKEFGLLEHLLRHPGRVLTREVLLNQVWGYDYFGTTRTVDVHVRRLKQKIPLLDEAILSVKSLGYKLKEP